MGKKILVVDDEPHIVKLLESRLKANGYTVISAANGNEGYEKAGKEQPDLILLDITMPVMTGKEALQKLKADPRTKAIPVIMITGRSGADDIVSCMSDGQAADYIVKPFVAGEFLKKINTALDASRRTAESSVNDEMLDQVEEKVRKTLENN